MVDLIPIGTVKRSPTENNPTKAPENVQQTEQTKALSDQRQGMAIDRRRKGDRRRSQGDRRLLQHGGRAKAVTDRRKTKDRRLNPRKEPDKTEKKPLGSRKGRIIDEQA